MSYNRKIKVSTNRVSTNRVSIDHFNDLPIVVYQPGDLLKLEDTNNYLVMIHSLNHHKRQYNTFDIGFNMKMNIIDGWEELYEESMFWTDIFRELK